MNNIKIEIERSPKIERDHRSKKKESEIIQSNMMLNYLAIYLFTRKLIYQITYSIKIHNEGLTVRFGNSLQLVLLLNGITVRWSLLLERCRREGEKEISKMSQTKETNDDVNCRWKVVDWAMLIDFEQASSSWKEESLTFAALISSSAKHSAMVLMFLNAASRAPVHSNQIDWLTRLSGETSTAWRLTVPALPIRVLSSRGPPLMIALIRICNGFSLVSRWMISNACFTIRRVISFLPLFRPCLLIGWWRERERESINYQVNQYGLSSSSGQPLIISLISLAGQAVATVCANMFNTYIINELTSLSTIGHWALRKRFLLKRPLVCGR